MKKAYSASDVRSPELLRAMRWQIKALEQARDNVIIGDKERGADYLFDHEGRLLKQFNAIEDAAYKAQHPVRHAVRKGWRYATHEATLAATMLFALTTPGMVQRAYADEPVPQEVKQDLQETVRSILAEGNVQNRDTKEGKVFVTLNDGRVLEYSDTPGKSTDIQILKDGNKVGTIYLRDEQKTLEHDGKTVTLTGEAYRGWENAVCKFFEGKELYPQEPKKEEPKQDTPKEPTLNDLAGKYFNEANVASRGVSPADDKIKLIMLKDGELEGLRLEYIDTPGSFTHINVISSDGKRLGNIFLSDKTKTVDFLDRSYKGLDETEYKAIESVVYRFFEQKELEEPKPEPKPDDKPKDEPKPEDKPKPDKKDDTFVKLTGSSLYLPGRLFDNNYARLSGGLETKDSGIRGRFDGTLSLGDLDLGWDLFYTGTSGIEGDADRDTSDLGGILSLRHKIIDLRLNAAMLDTDYGRDFASTAMLSPTLQQDTSGSEETSIETLLFSGALDYRLNDSLLIQLLGWSNRTKDTHLLSQTDHIFGTVLVPGFGPVAVDDTVLTDVSTKTLTREQGIGMGFDVALSKYTKLSLLPVYTRRSISTTVNGDEILDEDYDNLRLQARFQWNSLVLTAGRLQQFNDDLDSEFIGAGHYSLLLGEHVLGQLHAGIDDNGKGFGGLMFNFNATRKLTTEDVMAAAAYRNFALDTAIDWGLTPDQRRSALWDSRDAFIRRTGGLTVEAWLRDRDGHNVYGIGFGVDLDPLIPSLILLGDFEGGRDYRQWSLGARKKLFTISDIPVSLGVGIQSIDDGDRGSSQGMLEIIIGGKQ
ncbi:hypothetical protein HY493_05090 [Candidatus Woesearchaeota archaeon]|nr:hypothetical protein [Candidatus Woesearchaeota archaeon]